MKKTIVICGAFLLMAVIALAQEKPMDTSKELQPTRTGLDEGSAKRLPTQHEHHQPQTHCNRRRNRSAHAGE